MGMKGVEVWTRWGRDMWLLEDIWQMWKEHEGVGTRVIRRGMNGRAGGVNPPLKKTSFGGETTSLKNTVLSTWAKKQ